MSRPAKGKDLLTVRLEEIPDKGLELQFDPKDARFAEILEEGADGDGPRTGSAEVRLELWPERLDCIGSLHVGLPQQCARCLEPFTLTLDRSFTQYLMRTSAEQPDDAEDGEIELTLRDLDRSSLVGDDVDLAAVLREELLLAMPGKLVCREDCKGICSGCGAELNHEECTCEPEIDPRWEALKGLKIE